MLRVPGTPDGEVSVGIRPEGFAPSERGALTCELVAVERMGRDTSVVARHADLDGVQMRAIVSSDARVNRHSESVRFDVRPEKCRLFDPATGERIRFEGDAIAEATAEGQAL